jgi:tetratricopeptide repeat protein 8
MQAAPRPGTSLSRPLTHSTGSAALRPVTQSGRPTTGFARPGTSARPLTGSNRVSTAQGTNTASQRVATALRGSKPSTARPTTTSGRFVRLGTASLASQFGGPFINVEHLDMTKYAQRKHLARVLCDYIMYNDHNTKCASALCQAAVVRFMHGIGTAQLPAGIPMPDTCKALHCTVS